MNHIHHGHFHSFLYILLITTRNFNCNESREINGACQFLWSHLSMLIRLHKNVHKIYINSSIMVWINKWRNYDKFQYFSQNSRNIYITDMSLLKQTRTPAFWGYPPPPHDYLHYWPVRFESQIYGIDQFILDPKSKQGESRKMRKICEKLKFYNFVINLTRDTPSNGSDYLWQIWK